MRQDKNSNCYFGIFWAYSIILWDDSTIPLDDFCNSMRWFQNSLRWLVYSQSEIFFLLHSQIGGCWGLLSNPYSFPFPVAEELYQSFPEIEGEQAGDVAPRLFWERRMLTWIMVINLEDHPNYIVSIVRIPPPFISAMKFLHLEGTLPYP